MLRTGHIRPLTLALASLAVGACGGGAPADSDRAAASTVGVPTIDAGIRSAPVVPGRPARVFVFAGWSAACEPMPAPDVTLTVPPSQGEITFRPGQETTIAASAAGTCAGRKVDGTGVYYTARADASGVDRFAVEARLQSGESLERAFEVTIDE